MSQILTTLRPGTEVRTTRADRVTQLVLDDSRTPEYLLVALCHDRDGTPSTEMAIAAALIDDLIDRGERAFIDRTITAAMVRRNSTEVTA